MGRRGGRESERESVPSTGEGPSPPLSPAAAGPWPSHPSHSESFRVISSHCKPCITQVMHDPSQPRSESAPTRANPDPSQPSSESPRIRVPRAHRRLSRAPAPDPSQPRCAPAGRKFSRRPSGSPDSDRARNGPGRRRPSPDLDRRRRRLRRVSACRNRVFSARSRVRPADAPATARFLRLLIAGGKAHFLVSPPLQAPRSPTCF